jgi:sec-independent protein translocase protein TatA
MRARVPAVAGPADPQEVPVADLGWPELTIIAIAVVVLFGWKRMPDMARSLGRSARIFKSEVDQMKTPDPVAEADERAASADAEVARLREELEARRHQA